MSFDPQRKQQPQARVAEWFKATDLRPVINDAWVRTPLLADFYSISQME